MRPALFRSGIRCALFLSVLVLVAATFTASFAARSQIEGLRSAGTKTLRVIGIDDPLRYHLHTWSGEVALRLGFLDYAAIQYRKAEPHAASSVARSATLARYGEALIGLGDRREAEKSLRRAIIFDPSNARAKEMLENLYRSQNRQPRVLL